MGFQPIVFEFIFFRKKAREKEESKKLSINITVSQKQPTEVEILKLIVSALTEATKAYFEVDETLRKSNQYYSRIVFRCL